MNKKVETILISEYPIPFKGIGSWTIMYTKLIINKKIFNHIICPKPETKLNLNYSFLKKNKFKIPYFNNRHLDYLNSLHKIIYKSDTKYVIHIVDNYGLIKPLLNYINKNFNRDNFYIQYSYHGFNPFYDANAGNYLFNLIDEVIFLTNLSYQKFLNYYNVFTPRVRIIHNGVDSNKFKCISKIEKNKLKHKYNLDEKLFFLWCSQDRQKKGLDFILGVWKKLYPNYKNKIELLIIGSDRKIMQEGVTNIGRVSNDIIHEYYQVTDIYLFPSLWKEGFGIVLAEALKCGCYCIASNQGGIPEVLQNGKLGLLVKNPNIIKNWIDSITKILINKLNYEDIDHKKKSELNKLYDINDWFNKITESIEDAKEFLNKM